MAGLAVLSFVFGNFAPILDPLPGPKILTYGLGAIVLAACAGLFAAALALGAAVMAGLAVAGVPRLFADKRSNAVPVDVELVIAVDVSYSMDPDEQALQREGYILALTSREFLQALREGAHGKIAITYFEWAGQFDQKIIMP